MDVQSFIKSGILEDYVAGQCNEAEQREVQQMASQYPEVKRELENIELALERIAMATSVMPSAGLKERILENLDNASMIPENQTPVSGSNNLNRILAISTMVLVAGLAWVYLAKTNEINALKKQNEELKTEVDNCVKRRESSEPMANLLRDTDTHPVMLTDGKEYHITIFNNKLRQECALDLSGLPTMPQGKYFQCWAIVEGKDPISLGMVQIDSPAGWQPLPYVDGAVAYAISEEENPKGNPSPTVVIASGNI